jgi:hypothetical protein
LLICLIDLCLAEVITGEAITGEAITGKATEGRVNASVTVYSLINFTIVSPQNRNYSFNPAENITLDLNISLNDGNPTNWTFTLVDLWLNVTINSSEPFIPNITIYPNTKTHNLTVSVENEIGVVSSQSVIFYVNVNNTVPVLTLGDRHLYVCEDGALDYTFNVSDAQDGGISVNLDPIDPFFIYPTYFTGYYQDIDLFSLILDKSYIGDYELMLSAADESSSDSESLNVTVIETNAYPDVENIGVATVWAVGTNTTYYEEVDVFDSDCDCDQSSGNFSFNLTYLNNGSRPFFGISQYGIMGFEANLSLLGPNNESLTYNLSLCVSDQALNNPHENISLCNQTGSNLTVCRNFSITTTMENRAPQIFSYYPNSLTLDVPGTQEIYFNVSELDLDGTIPDTYWYVDGDLIEYDPGSNSDEFRYIFGCGVSGLHNIVVETTDGSDSCYGGRGCNDSIQWVIVVEQVSCSVPSGETGGGGGGGGGAVGGAKCIESWACNPWWTCNNAEESLTLGELNGEDYRAILEDCTTKKWDGDNCGYQMRECIDTKSCGSEIAKPNEMQACYFTVNPGCSDGIKNCHDGNCEFMIDCGGPCDPCPTCSDGIQNQAETETDCGGPCPNICQSEVPLLQPKRVQTIYIFIALVLFLILGIKLYQMIQLKILLGKRKTEEEKG